MKARPKKSWAETFFLKNKRPYLWFLCVGFLLFGRALSFDFIPLDDRILVVDNHAFLSNPANIPHVFVTDFFKITGDKEVSKRYYRPIVTLSLMLDATVGGVAPRFYHLSNILYHILAVGLLFLFLQKLGFLRELSFLFALIFLVHPVLTQAVGWILGRNDTLLAIFVLSAFISLLKLRVRGWGGYLWHLFFVACALFTKESAVGILFLMVWLLWFMKKENPVTFSHWLLMGGWVGVASLWFFMRQLAMAGATASVGKLLSEIFTHTSAILLYLGKIFFPYPLSGFPTLHDVPIWFGVGALALLVLLFWSTPGKCYARIFFAAGWFILFLLPGFAALLNFPALFEHRVYVPLIGVLLLLLQTRWVQQLASKELWVKAGLPIVLVLSVLTFSHLGSFRDDLSFWTNVTRNSPGLALGHVYMAQYDYEAGRLDQALERYKRAVSINEREKGAHNALGVIYAQQQKVMEAEKEFRTELQYYPNNPDAMVNLSRLDVMYNRIPEAETRLKRVMALDPGYRNGYEALLVLYLNLGRVEEARALASELKKKGHPVPPEILKALNL